MNQQQKYYLPAGMIGDADRRILAHLQERTGQVIPRAELQAFLPREGSRPGSRSIDTSINVIRGALGPFACHLRTIHSFGYVWIGKAISATLESLDELYDTGVAVMSQAAVSQVLGLSIEEIREIETAALARLKQNPEAVSLIRSLVTMRRRCTYDPFYEVWLYSTKEES